MPRFIIVRGIFIILLLILFSVDFFITDISLIIYTITVLFFILLGIGSANIQMNFFIKGYHQLNYPAKSIALTFDDGPHPVYTLQILEVLKKYNASATFFCVGKHMKDNENVIREVIRQGHKIGNHSYSHSYYFSFFNRRKVISEINQTNYIIKEITGQRCDIFRPPYGVTNPPIAEALKRLEMKLIGWNIRSFDTSVKDPEKVVRRVIKKIKPGGVILFHDNRKNTPKILESILQYTTKNNYTYSHVQEHI